MTAGMLLRANVRRACSPIDLIVSSPTAILMRMLSARRSLRSMVDWWGVVDCFYMPAATAMRDVMDHFYMPIASSPKHAPPTAANV